jgi:hypothetical protein
MIGSLLVEPALDSLEQLSIQNRRLLTGKDLALEGDLSDVKSVSQEVGNGTTG